MSYAPKREEQIDLFRVKSSFVRSFFDSLLASARKTLELFLFPLSLCVQEMRDITESIYFDSVKSGENSQ